MSTATNSESPEKSTLKRCFCILTLVCSGFLLQGASFSHLTAFFELYGLKEKALSSTQYGIIIGTYCLVLIIGMPLAAKLINLKYFQDKTLLLVAWTVDAAFSLLLSFAYKLERGNPFFSGCLILRILEACGCAMGFVMPYVITGREMSKYSHITIPVLETIYGTSVVIGPAFSGALYDLGGFPMPFRVLGGILLLWMLLTMALFPKAQKADQKEEQDGKEDVSAWTALEFPVFVNALCTVSGFIALASNESTLSLQLNTEFGMSPTHAGLVFLLPGGCYAVASLFLGFFSKRVADPRFMVFFGHLLLLVAMVLQGPLIPIVRTKTIFFIAQILLGVGVGPSLVCGYLQSLRYLSKGNETEEIHAALSAIFLPASLLGSTIGPLLAGIVRHYCSYTAVVAANAVQVGLCAMLLLITTCAAKNKARTPGELSLRQTTLTAKGSA